jgi:hypothetical protein
MSAPLSQRITPTRRERLLRVACVLALVALALIVWSMLDPRPLPVLVGLSLGQALGTLSFLAFLIIVAADLHLRRKLRE